MKDTTEAFAVLKAIAERERPEIVSFGDSETMHATGIVGWLRGDGRWKLLDGFDPAMCNSPDRVCNTRMEMLRCWPAGRVLVVLIDQELGL